MYVCIYIYMDYIHYDPRFGWLCPNIDCLTSQNRPNFHPTISGVSPKKNMCVWKKTHALRTSIYIYIIIYIDVYIYKSHIIVHNCIYIYVHIPEIRHPQQSWVIAIEIFTSQSQHRLGVVHVTLFALRFQPGSPKTETVVDVGDTHYIDT